MQRIREAVKPNFLSFLSGLRLPFLATPPIYTLRGKSFYPVYLCKRAVYCCFTFRLHTEQTVERLEGLQTEYKAQVSLLCGCKGQTQSSQAFFVLKRNLKRSLIILQQKEGIL